MKILTTMAVVAVTLLAGSSSALAVDQLPPKAGSVCEGAIAQYVEEEHVLVRGVVQIGSNLEKDGQLYFGLYGDLREKIQSVSLGDLEPVKGPKRLLNDLHALGKSSQHGMWLVVTPGVGSKLRAQVFVAGVKGRTPTCYSVYEYPVDFLADNLPKDILD